MMNSSGGGSGSSSAASHGHEAGRPLECLSHAIELRKEARQDPISGETVMRVGFKVGGGIDQDPAKAPFNYPDTVRMPMSGLTVAIA